MGHVKPWKVWQREVTGPSVLMKQPLRCWYVWNDPGTTTDSWIPVLCRATLRPLSQHKSADLRTACTHRVHLVDINSEITTKFMFPSYSTRKCLLKWIHTRQDYVMNYCVCAFSFSTCSQPWPACTHILFVSPCPHPVSVPSYFLFTSDL